MFEVFRRNAGAIALMEQRDLFGAGERELLEDLMEWARAGEMADVELSCCLRRCSARACTWRATCSTTPTRRTPTPPRASARSCSWAAFGRSPRIPRRMLARPPLRVTAGVGLVAACTLALQVLLTRLFSAVLFYHFAFFSISLALLGTGAGALVLYVRPNWFERPSIEAPWRAGRLRSRRGWCSCRSCWCAWTTATRSR